MLLLRSIGDELTVSKLAELEGKLSAIRGVRKVSRNCRFVVRNIVSFDICPPGNEVLNCTWVSGRDSVMEGQLTTLRQTADRMWTISPFVSVFFCDGHRWC